MNIGLSYFGHVTYGEKCYMTTLLLSPTGTCVKKLDIVVVLDDSTSEGIDGFHSIKEFVIGLIRDMEVGPDKTSVLPRTSTPYNPTVEFNFKNDSSKLKLEMAVSDLIYGKGATGNISHLPYKRKTNMFTGWSEIA